MRLFIPNALLFASLFSRFGLSDEICPEKPLESDACIAVNSWNGLKAVIESATGTVVFCPFDVTQIDRNPITITNGVNLMCKRVVDSDECTIRGEGIHIASTSTTEVVLHGFSFKESNEHAIHIESSIPTNVHTFCDCLFVDNRRLDIARGGAIKTEISTGTVNVVSCTFRDNFSGSFGGAIYTRSNVTNIVNSVFNDNSAGRAGGAIAAARYADLFVRNSSFSGYGDDSIAILIKPIDGPMVATDGGNNLATGGCNGFFDWSSGVCIEFVAPPSSPAPSTSLAPSASPTTPIPTQSPSDAPTQTPSSSQVPTSAPSVSPSQTPTLSLAPSSSPTVSPAPTTVSYGKCGDLLQYSGQTCVPVTSWSDFLAEVTRGASTIVFCSFSIMNDSGAAAIIDSDINMICPSRSCTIYGPSSHLVVEADTQVLVSGFTFAGSEQTAVSVMGSSSPYSAVTTFCACSFRQNKREGEAGGALRAETGSGEVNLVECTLSNNKASVGGAIFSRAFRLNVVGTTIAGNNATVWGGSIFVDEQSHLLVRGSRFSRNQADKENYSIVVHPRNHTGMKSSSVDAGGNVASNDGQCKGFFINATAYCQEFLPVPSGSSLVYPYIPGELSVRDASTGLVLSSGLSVRVLARSGEPVSFASAMANRGESVLPFHGEPDGAAVVETDDGGWIYVSNCENANATTGGVFSLVFDSTGEIRDYRQLLGNTTRNCNGGLTPWMTWVSCEEVAAGQCWQVDPHGRRIPEPTSIVEPEGGNFEAFAYDIRNASQPCYFVTEDHERGALRRWRPDNYLLNETWKSLHGNGTRHYLKLIPEEHRFEWTPYLEIGRASAQLHFPWTEGISHKGDGLLYFVSKHLKTLYICNLDTLEYRTELTNETGILKGDGKFSDQPDHVIQRDGSDMLYFTEDGGKTAGVYARKPSTGEYFAIFEAQGDIYDNDEATGLAWSPDWTRMYVCIQTKGLLFEIRRDDGLPFEHDAHQLHLKYHSVEEE